MPAGRTVVIAGPNDPGLAKPISEKLGAQLVTVQEKIFPDGELYVRISEPDTVRNSCAILVNTLYPEQNKSWIETLFLTNALRNTGASMVIVVIPYLAYSRQDKVFLEGEPVSISVMLKALRNGGADCLLTIDVHNPLSLKEFNGCAINIMVSDVLAKKAAEYTESPIVLAPDKGALERAKIAAEAIGAEYDYLIKKRDRVTGEVSVEPKELSVEGKDVIIIDDIISTGGTIALAAKKSLESGAKSVILAASHSLLVDNAMDKIKSSGAKKLVTANTLNKKFTESIIEVVDVSNKIVDVIKTII